MNKKVELTKDQANVLTDLRKEYIADKSESMTGVSFNEHMIYTHMVVVLNDTDEWLGICKCLNTLSIEEMVIALLDGYTVEKTKEEKLLEYYIDSSIEEANSIKIALNLLDIHIEGINSFTKGR